MSHLFDECVDCGVHVVHFRHVLRIKFAGICFVDYQCISVFVFEV